ncbi:hypothetical protein P9112_000982 [Eukaryota sp. TZLM1-RC]
MLDLNSINITADPSITSDVLSKVLSSHPLTSWAAEVDPEIKVHGLHVQSVDMFGSSKVGFIKFKADCSVDGHRVPGIVFCRGAAVAILMVLVNASNGEEYCIMTEQCRVPCGKSKFIEIPAGMLENGQFKGTAAAEVQEETGITIDENHLVDLIKEVTNSTGSSFPGMYPSPGGCDEYIKLYLYRKEISQEELNELDGKLTGLREDGEHIVLRLFKMQDLPFVTADGKALAACLLYRTLKGQK